MRQIMRKWTELVGLCGICPIMRRSPIMRKVMRAHNRIIQRSLVWGGYGAFKVIGNVTIRQSTYMTSCSILTETMRLSCIVFSRFSEARRQDEQVARVMVATVCIAAAQIDPSYSTGGDDVHPSLKMVSWTHTSLLPNSISIRPNWSTGDGAARSQL